MKFLINTITSWDEPPRCRHQVAMELARTHEVVFIEKNRSGIPKIEALQENKNLTRLLPFWPVDARIRYRIPLLNALYQEFLFRRVKQLIAYDKDHDEGNDWQVINFDHTATRILTHFKRNQIVYYCNDDHIGNGHFNPGWVNLYHRRAERRIIEGSAFCIGTSDYLYRKLSAGNANTRLILLGAPGNIPDRYKVFKNQDKNPGTIKVAYVGFMQPGKLCFDSIRACLSDPRLHLTFIGPQNREVLEAFPDSDRVAYQGVKVGEDLYAALSDMNLCICPYNLAGINLGTTPNKLWLYMALGKPAVVTRIPNMESWEIGEDLYYRADSASDYPRLVEQAFLRDSDALFRGRIEAAAQNSWESRVNELKCVLRSQS